MSLNGTGRIASVLQYSHIDSKGQDITSTVLVIVLCYFYGVNKSLRPTICLNTLLDRGRSSLVILGSGNMSGTQPGNAGPSGPVRPTTNGVAPGITASQQPQGAQGAPGNMPPGGMSQSNLNSIVSVQISFPCDTRSVHMSLVSSVCYRNWPFSHVTLYLSRITLEDNGNISTSWR